MRLRPSAGTRRNTLSKGDKVKVYGEYNNYWYVKTERAAAYGETWVFVEKGKVEETVTFTWPINDTREATINKKGVFGFRIFGYTDQDTKIEMVSHDFHKGIDMPGNGMTVKAAAGGKVITAALDGSAGYTVVVEHDNGMRTRYQHLQKDSIPQVIRDARDNGTKIEQGATIGKSGNTGRSSGAHLHFEVMRSDARNSQVNPLAIYNTEEDIRGCDELASNPHPKPVYRLVNGNYEYNPGFDPAYNTNGETDRRKDYTGLHDTGIVNVPRRDFSLNSITNNYWCGHATY